MNEIERIISSLTTVLSPAHKQKIKIKNYHYQIKPGDKLFVCYRKLEYWCEYGYIYLLPTFDNCEESGVVHLVESDIDGEISRWFSLKELLTNMYVVKVTFYV